MQNSTRIQKAILNNAPFLPSIWTTNLRILFRIFCQILQLVIPKVQLQLCELLCMFLFVNVMDELSRQLFFQFFFLIYEIFFCFCFVCHHELNVFFYHHFSFSFTDFRFFFSSKKNLHTQTAILDYIVHIFCFFCLLPTQTSTKIYFSFHSK